MCFAEAWRNTASIYLYFLSQDDLLEMVILPQFAHISDDPSPHIRKVVVLFLLDIAKKCQVDRCLDVLDIIARVRDSISYPKTDLKGKY